MTRGILACRIDLPSQFNDVNRVGSFCPGAFASPLPLTLWGKRNTRSRFWVCTSQTWTVQSSPAEIVDERLGRLLRRFHLPSPRSRPTRRCTGGGDECPYAVP